MLNATAFTEFMAAAFEVAGNEVSLLREIGDMMNIGKEIFLPLLGNTTQQLSVLCTLILQRF